MKARMEIMHMFLWFWQQQLLLELLTEMTDFPCEKTCLCARASELSCMRHSYSLGYWMVSNNNSSARIPHFQGPPSLICRNNHNILPHCDFWNHCSIGICLGWYKECFKTARNVHLKYIWTCLLYIMCFEYNTSV